MRKPLQILNECLRSASNGFKRADFSSGDLDVSFVLFTEAQMFG